MAYDCDSFVSCIVGYKDGLLFLTGSPPYDTLERSVRGGGGGGGGGGSHKL